MPHLAYLNLSSLAIFRYLVLLDGEFNIDGS